MNWKLLWCIGDALRFNSHQCESPNLGVFPARKSSVVGRDPVSSSNKCDEARVHRSLLTLCACIWYGAGIFSTADAARPEGQAKKMIWAKFRSGGKDSNRAQFRELTTLMAVTTQT